MHGYTVPMSPINTITSLPLKASTSMIYDCISAFAVLFQDS